LIDKSLRVRSGLRHEFRGFVNLVIHLISSGGMLITKGKDRPEQDKTRQEHLHSIHEDSVAFVGGFLVAKESRGDIVQLTDLTTHAVREGEGHQVIA
jgi:hypothetical protein